MISDRPVAQIALDDSAWCHVSTAGHRRARLGKRRASGIAQRGAVKTLTLRRSADMDARVCAIET